MNDLTPIVRKAVELCDCYKGDYRQEVQSFYKRDGGHIKCSECEEIPYELSMREVDDSVRVVLEIYHHIDEETTRVYKEIFPVK